MQMKQFGQVAVCSIRIGQKYVTTCRSVPLPLQPLIYYNDFLTWKLAYSHFRFVLYSSHLLLRQDLLMKHQSFIFVHIAWKSVFCSSWCCCFWEGHLLTTTSNVVTFHMSCFSHLVRKPVIFTFCFHLCLGVFSSAKQGHSGIFKRTTIGTVFV